MNYVLQISSNLDFAYFDKRLLIFHENFVIAKSYKFALLRERD